MGLALGPANAETHFGVRAVRVALARDSEQVAGIQCDLHPLHVASWLARPVSPVMILGTQ
jgi:hypothetical protein